MPTIGAFEAKTHFAELHDRVEHGEEITVTRRGTPAARLAPARPARGPATIRAALRMMDEAARGSRLDRITIEMLLDGLTPVGRIWGGAFELAERHRLTVDDAACLEPALRRALPPASLDDDLRDAAGRAGVTLSRCSPRGCDGAPLAGSLDLLYLAVQQGRRSGTAALEAVMASGRPLSPHLQIYRWYLTMALSIAHRASGVALTLGLVLVVIWLNALAAGPDAYTGVAAVTGSVPGRLVLFVWTFVLLFHAFNGVRHLVWDAGYGFEKVVARQSGIVVVAAAGLATVLLWVAALALA